MTAKVWVVGEGNHELGRDDGYGRRGRGLLEALLARVCKDGWQCSGKLPWRSIQKFRAGGARLSAHGDCLNVLGLVFAAYEEAADVAAFSRDVDSDPDRERAIDMALAWLRTESGWAIEVIGGVAKPAIEGWILALLAIPDTDDMSRARAHARLAEHRIDAKVTDDYVEIVEQAALGESPRFSLPAGSESLRAWLALAHQVLNQVVHGRPAP